MTPTDEQLRLLAAAHAKAKQRIMGFSTPKRSKEAGFAYTVRDLSLPRDQQVLWQGETMQSYFDALEAERMRLALTIAGLTVVPAFLSNRDPGDEDGA